MAGTVALDPREPALLVRLLPRRPEALVGLGTCGSVGGDCVLGSALDSPASVLPSFSAVSVLWSGQQKVNLGSC